MIILFGLKLYSIMIVFELNSIRRVLASMDLCQNKLADPGINVNRRLRISLCERNLDYVSLRPLRQLETP
jgi:hypothetical protein